MGTPESHVKARVDTIIALVSHVIVNPMTRGMGVSGVSDKLTCVAGRFVAIEVKSIHAEGQAKYPTKLQYRFLNQVMQSGGAVAVINESNVDLLHAWLSNGATTPLLFQGCPSVEQGSQLRKVSTG